ncbi:flagellar basal body-associated protein FliL [Planctobacterium marinum]|uniref:flagellar basal body-associated protein FliL n=1 Tax=Planctobacterium marinum TaxID=1631968 RepID=UPI001E57449F|nr:flagellar basal body-associated protein FliL [Planctobacterium marinum]MCC2606201.1 flagellar basal body-associated protein FliL [Planctobacterium marinum]
MAEQELQMEESAPKKGKMMIIIAAAVVVIIGAAAAFFLLGDSSDESALDELETEEVAQQQQQQVSGIGSTNVGTALYVAMPRPFVFNVPGSGRDRLVQIKVQLMVRGTDAEETAKMHIPMIEGTLLRVFSSSNADDLVTEAGKIAMKEQSLREVQKAMQEIAGNPVIEQVLFTGFVMQ